MAAGRVTDVATRHGQGPGSSQLDPSTGLVVATCHWHGCDQPAPVAVKLGLVPPGSRVVREPFAVPLCKAHILEAQLTGRVNLAYHPDDRLDQ